MPSPAHSRGWPPFSVAQHHAPAALRPATSTYLTHCAAAARNDVCSCTTHVAVASKHAMDRQLPPHPGERPPHSHHHSSSSTSSYPTPYRMPTAQPPTQTPFGDPFSHGRDPFLTGSHATNGGLGSSSRGWPHAQGTFARACYTRISNAADAPAVLDTIHRAVRAESRCSAANGILQRLAAATGRDAD